MVNDRGAPAGQFDNAYGNLTSGDFQEWQLGVELSVPIGFRRAHAGVRNAELMLARDRALLRDQQREVIHELSDAIAEMDRTFVVAQTSYNRLMASRQQLAALVVPCTKRTRKCRSICCSTPSGGWPEAESRYYRALAEYAMATKNVHFVKGTLLDYDGVYLAEGPGRARPTRTRPTSNRCAGQPRPLELRLVASAGRRLGRDAAECRRRDGWRHSARRVPRGRRSAAPTRGTDERPGADRGRGQDGAIQCVASHVADNARPAPQDFSEATPARPASGGRREVMLRNSGSFARIAKPCDLLSAPP